MPLRVHGFAKVLSPLRPYRRGRRFRFRSHSKNHNTAQVPADGKTPFLSQKFPFRATRGNASRATRTPRARRTGSEGIRRGFHGWNRHTNFRWAEFRFLHFRQPSKRRRRFSIPRCRFLKRRKTVPPTMRRRANTLRVRLGRKVSYRCFKNAFVLGAFERIFRLFQEVRHAFRFRRRPRFR